MRNSILEHILINIIFLFFFLIFPIAYHTIGLLETVLAIIGFLGLGLIGSVLISFSKTIKDMVVFWMLSYIIGGALIGTLSVVLSAKILGLVFVLLCFFSLLLLLRRKNKFNEIENEIGIYPMLISVVIIFAYILIDGDIYQAKSIFPFQSVNGLPDPYFFTLVAHSLSVDTIFNAFYDQGAPINYQIISFLTPSFFTKLFNIPSQISLWGMWMPIYKLFAFLMLAFGIKKSINHSYTKAWWFIPIIIVLLFTLAPINPKYIINFDLSKIVFLGTGYILPGGNPPFTMAMILMGAVLLLFKQQDWILFDGLLYTCLLAFVIGTKTALFVPLGIYLGILSIFKYKENKKPFVYTIMAGIMGVCIYILLFSNSYGLINISFRPGFYIEDFNKLMGTKGTINGVLIMCASLLIWGGIRWAILFLGFLNNKKQIYSEIIAMLCAFLLTLLLPLLLRLELMDPKGLILQDLTFDLVQFVRAAFFLLSVSSIVVLFSLNLKNVMFSKIAFMGLCIYCTVTLVSNSYRLFNTVIVEEDKTWRNEIRRESKVEGLFAIAANSKYSGQLLAAEGIGPWWFSCKRGDGSGYIMTNKNYYRSQIIEKLLKNEDPEIQIDKMKKEGVSYIIAHPDNIGLFEQLKKNGLLIQKKGHKWLFNLKPKI